jgi:lysophospholipase L1-like esterase
MIPFTSLAVGDSIIAGGGATKQFVTAWFPLVCAAMQAHGGARVLLDLRAVDGLAGVATTARYVRLYATGAGAGGSWWRIGELNLIAAGGGNLSRAGWSASAFRTAFGAAASVLDSNLTTFWLNGDVPVTSGNSQDWFQIDGGVGADLNIGGILQDTTNWPTEAQVATGDIYTSANGANWNLQASWVLGDMVAGLLTHTFAKKITLPWIVPRVGGAVTFTRASTGDQVESGGSTTTKITGTPLVNWYVDPLTSVRVATYLVRPASAPRVADFLQIAYTQPPQPATYFAEFYEDVASGSATGRLFEIGDGRFDGTTYLRVFRSSGTYQVRWYNFNSGAGVTASTGALTWAIGDRIRLRIVHYPDGSIQIWGRVNDAAEVSAGVTAANAFASTPAWNQLMVTLGADFAGANVGSQGFVGLQAATGVLTQFPVGSTLYASIYNTGPSSGNRNLGVSGRTLQTVAAMAPTQEFAIPGIAGPPKHLLFMMAGTNDLSHNQTLAQMQADWTAYAAGAVAAGYLLVALTVLPTTAITAAGTEAQRVSFNAWMVANGVALGATLVSDVGSLASMSDPTGPNYVDGIHCSDAGHALVAAQVVTDLAAIL